MLAGAREYQTAPGSSTAGDAAVSGGSSSARRLRPKAEAAVETVERDLPALAPDGQVVHFKKFFLCFLKLAESGAGQGWHSIHLRGARIDQAAIG